MAIYIINVNFSQGEGERREEESREERYPISRLSIS
jgi:hypothetical protein